MGVQLKKLKKQVMVITGASSGIGLVTARMAAANGARLVLAARNGEALEQVARQLRNAGGEAIHVEADVSKEKDVVKIAEKAINQFGAFDTWVNNAGVSIYGRLLDISIEDQRQLFEINFWGVVYGSRVAALHMKSRGGALINLGSALSDRAIPLQGVYSASKHAVKAYTDALRMELEEQGAPISVTLIKPSAIDTPYKEHAKNYLAVEPKHPAPVYAPEAVAEAILHCAEHPERDVFVGSGAKALSFLGHYSPRLTDKFMERAFFSGQRTDEPAHPKDQNSLYSPAEDLHERGVYRGHVSEVSLYTKASLNPIPTAAVIASAGFAVAAYLVTKATGREPRRLLREVA